MVLKGDERVYPSYNYYGEDNESQTKTSKLVGNWVKTKVFNQGRKGDQCYEVVESYEISPGQINILIGRMWDT